MKYFLHDTSSFEDEKVTMLFIEYGYEGLGLFYTILEKLAKQEKPIKTKVLKVQLKVGKKLEKCWKYMEEIELLSSNNGETSNERILNFSESIDEKRKKTSKRVFQHRENQEDVKYVTRYNDDCNAPNSTEHNNTITSSDEEEKEYPPSQLLIEDIVEDFKKKEAEEVEEKKRAAKISRSPPIPTLDEAAELFRNLDEIKNTARKNHSLSELEYDQAINRFVADKKFEGYKVSSESDVRSHFGRWLKYYKDLPGVSDGPNESKGKIEKGIEVTAQAEANIRARRALENN